MIAKYSVKKPYTVVVAMVLILILGMVSFFNMTTDLLPNLDLPYVVVITPYPGAAPEKVELVATKPLEQVLSTTSGLVEINSVSSENSSMIIMEFNNSVNMDSVMIELSGSIDTIKGYWPSDVGNPIIMRLNPDMLPVMVASVDMDGKSMEELSNLTTNEIIPTFERIDGVATVTGSGLLEESIYIQLDQDKIDAINIELLESVDAQLATGQRAINKAKKELADGQTALEQQRREQTAKLTEAQAMLDAAKEQVNSGLTLTNVELSALQYARQEAQTQLDALLIKQGAGTSTPTEDALIITLQTTIPQIDTNINTLNTQKATLEAASAEIADKQKQLDLGWVTLTSELGSASAQLKTGELLLEQQTESFNASRDAALKNANIDGLVTQSTISTILTAENFSMPAGYVVEGESTYLVKVGEQFNTIEELENMMLLDTGEDAIGVIRLCDVATVSYYSNEGAIYAKVNGNDAVLLQIQKQSTASTVDVADEVNEVIAQLQSETEGLHITALMDQGIYIHMVIDSVLENLMYGGILAIIILILFLKDFRPTIIIAFSIPISLLFAVALMYFSNMTLNVISLAGLALGVGMLVDNSIVVIENIYRLRGEGVPPIKAAIQGTSEVAGAIAASTLTTVCVFLPIVFTEGISRQIFTDMGLTIGYALVASLIVAVTLVPMMSATILKENKERENKFFTRLVSLYEKGLRWVLTHKAVSLLVVIGVFAYSVYATTQMGTAFLPEMSSPQMSMTITIEEGASQAEIVEQIDAVLNRISEIDDIETIGAMQDGEKDLTIDVYVLLKEENREYSNKEISTQIMNLTNDLPVEIEVTESTMDISMLSGSGIQIEIKGNDLDTLQSVAKEVSDIVKATEGTVNVEYAAGETSTETRIVVDKDKAMQYGLTVAQVYQKVNELIADGKTATTVTINEKDYPVIVFNATRDGITRETLTDITFEVTNSDREEVTICLGDIATIQEVEGMQAIRRTNQVRYVTVNAEIADGYNIGLVSRELEAALAGFETPTGYTIHFEGENKTINDALRDLVLMILLAIVFIYLIMVAQFQSLLSPFIVMFTLPLAFTGGLLGLLATGSTLSVISMLGFLVLAGVIVNNGIVFVDYANQLMLSGMSKREALIQTGVTRIKPILMTTLTTVLGLSTLALGLGAGAEMLQPMGIVVVCGLSYATLMTLFIVPILYEIFQRRELKPIEEEE